MKFKLNHGYEVGQIVREGNHFRKVIRVLGPLYEVAPYSINECYFPKKQTMAIHPATLTWR